MWMPEPNLAPAIRIDRALLPHRRQIMLTLDDVLERWIPYRLQAIETLRFAWDWLGESDEPHAVLVLVEGKPVLHCNVAAIANPMLEAGVVHARALFEFLGLAVKNGRLAQVQRRLPGDIAIEHYSTAGQELAMVSPEQVYAAYDGPHEEAESAIVAIFEFANKLTAHITDGTFSGAWTDQHLDIACRGIPVLLNNHLYAKLGRTLPPAPNAIPKRHA